MIVASKKKAERRYSPGRPPKTDRTAMAATRSISLPTPVWEVLDRIVENEGTGRSSLILEALNLLYEKKGVSL